jgi:SAM-dependent methyltransferase
LNEIIFNQGNHNTEQMTELIADSRFWEPAWSRYHRTPSIALCRIPELEYASTLQLEGRTLDHCCGDGSFAALAWPLSKFTAGCDLNRDAIKLAGNNSRHEQLDMCDAGRQLPYEDQSFDLVFDNSALEHILDLDSSLSEVARVTRRGGRFAFNVLNHRFFEWWPMDEESKRGYREWQPFFHAYSLDIWKSHLADAGLEIEEVRGYFDEESARELALLDCEFSGYFIRQRASSLVSQYNSLLGRHKRLWRKRIAGLRWRTKPDEGAGYFIIAKRS